MKTFTNKKIQESLRKVENLNFAVVKDDGELYIHCHGQAMIESVYNNRDAYCDVTNYVADYIAGWEYDKANTARMIREAAEIFYE